jgi:hypothetical protein
MSMSDLGTNAAAVAYIIGGIGCKLILQALCCCGRIRIVDRGDETGEVIDVTAGEADESFFFCLKSWSVISWK